MDETIDQWLALDKSPRFYQEYVGLFQAYFPSVDSSHYRPLNKAAYYHYHSLLLLDDLLDNNSNANLFVKDRLQECSVRLLAGVFGTYSPFWGHWNKRNQGVFEAIQLDHKLMRSTTVKFEEYRELADLKSSAGLLAIDCLSTLDSQKNPALYQALIESHKCFSTAFQLYDDIKDFKDDWKNSQFNWAVYLFKSVSEDDDECDLDLNQKSFYLDGTAGKLFDLCSEQLDKAIKVLPKEVDSQWTRVCFKMKEEMIRYRDHVQAYLMCLNKKQIHMNQMVSHLRLPDLKGTHDRSLQRAWCYMQRSFSRGWGDLPHWMWLSSNDGFSSGDKVKKGEVFQMTMVWECISFVVDPSDTEWRHLLENEWRHILSLKTKGKDGVWAYFSDVPELADDIDDLAQVIQFMRLLNKEDKIEKYCSSAIEVVLEQRSIQEGVWETWIVPVRNRNPLQEKQEWLNTRMWGRGPDLEVVANFAYSLYSWRPLHYMDLVKKSVGFLVANQKPEGYWSSRWYIGKLYGTYQCVRIVQLMSPEQMLSLRNAQRFTLSMQNSDGGFSNEIEQPSDPLSTAFAILVLRIVGLESKEVFAKAKAYLAKNQNKDGSWDPCAFIIAKPGSVYKSAVMTTAWVMRAIDAIKENEPAIKS